MAFNILSSFLLATALLAAPPAAAPQPQLMHFWFNGHADRIAFVEDAARDALVTADCAAKPESCEALKRLPKASTKGLEKKLQGGANPGAVVCRLVLKGRVVIGTDDEDNESSFCSFEDGSMVDSGTILRHARRPTKNAQ